MKNTAKIESFPVHRETGNEAESIPPFTDGEFVTVFERYLRRTSLGRKIPLPRWARW